MTNRIRCGQAEVALTEWIAGAVDECVDASDAPFDFDVDERAMALSSDAYLLPALRVARSLAEQVCLQRMLPAQGSSWADNVTVRISSDASREGADAADGNVSVSNLDELTARPEEDELADALKLFSDEEEGIFDETKMEEKHQHFSYLSVQGANLSAFSDIDVLPDILHEKSEMRCIHSLGLVLYEIFSGGERPQTENMPARWDKKECSPICLGGVLNIHDKNPKRTKAQINLVSVEPLKLLGISTNICNLVANMIDCGAGDLIGEETYSHMRDICSDLQLMMETPEKFLRDIDIASASKAGLPLNETKFGRDQEMIALQNSYQRSMSGGSEVAIIRGASGSGKSVLARHLGSYISSEGGIFLHGKFVQLQQSRPFSALAAAFLGYCNVMSTRGTNHAEEVISKLKLMLGAKVHHLARVIPNLSSFLGLRSTEQFDEDQECVDAQERLLYLFCQFVEVISTYSGAPIVLFLDDLQWADKASLAVIKQLLTMPSSSSGKRPFFLGCCREEGLAEDHPLGAMLFAVRRLGINITEVRLQCMSKETINGILSKLFRLSPRLTRPLADTLFHKTKGNPLFFSQLMMSLKKEGVLWLSLDRRRWEWDLDKVRSRELPSNVADYFADTIKRLPAEVKSALTLLSCFGARSERSLMETLESLLSLRLVQPMEVATLEGLLIKTEGQFCFSHDRVQEAAYERTRPEERPLLHFKYGIALASTALERNDNNLLFVAVGQINRGGPMAMTPAEDDSKRALIAQMNLRIGRESMARSDFASAYSFFDNGISFLQKGHWKENYNLSFELFEAAAKCALVLGDLAGLNILSEQVLKFARSFEDKLPVLYVSTCSLACANKLPECIEQACSVLAQLGENFPSECFPEDTIRMMVEQTRVILDGFTEEDLLDHKQMRSRSKATAMRFLAILETVTQYAKPDMQPIVTLKSVQFSIAFGMTPTSPVAFAYFGMLVARLGYVREGYRYVKLAKALLDRVGSERAGEVIFVGTQIRCFVEPIQATYELHMEGYKASMATGDISNALTNMICYAVGSFEAGIDLQIVKENCEKACQVMEQHNHLTFLIALVTVQRSILGIMGETVSSKWESLSPYSSLLDYLNNMFLDFTFRNYEQLKMYAEKYFDCNHVKSWSLLYSHVTHESIAGLASFWIYRKSNDPIWLERGAKARERYQNWYEAALNISLESRFHLLEAEELYAKKDIESAKSLYERAISSARKHRFVNDEAFACELTGYFILETDEKDAAIKYFMQAHEKFHEWGAVAKSMALLDFVKQIDGTPPTD